MPKRWCAKRKHEIGLVKKYSKSHIFRLTGDEEIICYLRRHSNVLVTLLQLQSPNIYPTQHLRGV